MNLLIIIISFLLMCSNLCYSDTHISKYEHPHQYRKRRRISSKHPSNSNEQKYVSKEKIKEVKEKKTSTIWSLSTGVDTSVSMNEKKDVNSLINIKGNYKITQKDILSLYIGLDKRFVKEVDLNESDFNLKAPYLNYTRTGIFSKSIFSIDAVFLRLEATSRQYYRSITRYGSIRIGGVYSLKIIDTLKISHSLLIDKYLNVFTNGPNGVYTSWDYINNFSLGWNPLGKLNLGISYTLVNTSSYEDGKGTSVITGANINYDLPKNWNIGCAVESYDDYTRYSRNELTLYNRNQAFFTFSISKVFK